MDDSKLQNESVQVRVSKKQNLNQSYAEFISKKYPQQQRTKTIELAEASIVLLIKL